MYNSEKSMKCLNLGCGCRFHPAWENLDFTSTGEGIITHNLTQGIPFSDNSIDVVYHSHLLEHFSRSEADFFLKECCRVLRPGGILRVVVPDLEKITRTYLLSLEAAIAGSQEWAFNYEWMLIQLYDQVSRHHSGGEMVNYVSHDPIPNEEFILKFSGVDAKNLITAVRQHQNANRNTKKSKIRQLLKPIYRLMREPSHYRELLLKFLLGNEYQSLQIGRFRQGGEVHQWMYDRYSLSLLLQNCGLDRIVQQTANESYLADWTVWNLDTETDGTIYKPDSLFMEAIKPAI